MKMKIHAALSLALFATSVGAQSYPVKPVRIIVPAGPGGGVDTIARFVGSGLSS
jgi:tripartite-type tricarboxylate transporter receptor subunit TctC